MDIDELLEHYLGGILFRDEGEVLDYVRFERLFQQTEDKDILNYTIVVAVEVTKEDFRRAYFKLMALNMYTKKWWINNTPLCDHCNKEIPGLKQLRMYESKPYHPECFEEVLDLSNQDPLMKKYWEKVLEIT